jgi:putative FmdB family regulatory protein
MCPVYSYECPQCQAGCREIRCIADHEQGPTCYRCGKAQMKQVVEAPMVLVKDPAVPRKTK